MNEIYFAKYTKKILKNQSKKYNINILIKNI